MNEWAIARPIPKRCDVGLGRRHMKRETDSKLTAPEVAPADEEIVRNQVVPDERDPSTEEPVVAQTLDNLALDLENLVGRLFERPTQLVPSPGADDAANADRAHSRSDPVGIRLGSGGNHGGHPVGDAFHARQHCRQFVVSRRVRRVHWLHPAEDRFARGCVVRYRRAHEPVTAEVLMGVDETRCYDASGQRRSRRTPGKRARTAEDRADVGDDVSSDGNCCSFEELASRILVTTVPPTIKRSALANSAAVASLTPLHRAAARR